MTTPDQIEREADYAFERWFAQTAGYPTFRVVFRAGAEWTLSLPATPAPPPAEGPGTCDLCDGCGTTESPTTGFRVRCRVCNGTDRAPSPESSGVEERLHHERGRIFAALGGDADHEELRARWQKLNRVILELLAALAEARRERKRLYEVVPQSLLAEVPDVVEAVRVTFAEYVRVAAESTAQRAQVAGLRAALNRLCEEVKLVARDTDSFAWHDLKWAYDLARELLDKPLSATPVEAERGPPREPSEAVLAEREACAKIAEGWAAAEKYQQELGAEVFDTRNRICDAIAAVIRARSATKG